MLRKYVSQTNKFIQTDFNTIQPCAVQCNIYFGNCSACSQ